MCFGDSRYPREVAVVVDDSEFLAAGLSGLELFSQRIVDSSGQTLKLELLSRLPATMTQVRLESFFGGLTPEQTLDVTLRQMQAAENLYAQRQMICSINVDNSVLVDVALRQKLVAACSRFVHPRVLEFTELRPMPPPDEINAIFFELKRHNTLIALDDFGTGFNGMSIFADYDFDIVKIDQSLVTGIQTRPQKLKILAHVRQLLDALEKDHVVEGVETEVQLAQLTELGYRNFQGYLFDRPVRIEEPVQNG